MRQITAILFLFLSLSASAQDAARPEKGTSEWYLKRAKSQKTAGIVLFTVGSTCFSIGLSQYGANASSDSKGRETLLLAGGASMVTGLGFMIAGGVSKRKGLSMGVKSETGYLPDPAMRHSFAAVRLTLSL